jgi:ParB-like chromosome segregation protein Spo0J
MTKSLGMKGDGYTEVVPIRIDQIMVRERARSLDPKLVVTLAVAESIKTLGMQSPITVRIAPALTVNGIEKTNVPVLVAGRHRLEAAKQLNMETIDCVITTGSDLVCQLWELDEKLCRAELADLERAEHLLRRKQIYKELPRR